MAKVLHVTLADPFIHHGGLNRYCRDLVLEERKQGYEVFVLYPGHFSFFHKERIVKRENALFELVNPLPVPLTYGVKHPKIYHKRESVGFFESWLKEQKFAAIHVHSIQGIPLEFFEAAKKIGIRMVFTTHDYYPICLKCTFFSSSGRYCSCHSYKDCAICCSRASLSLAKQVLRQSRIYAFLKRKMQLTPRVRSEGLSQRNSNVLPPKDNRRLTSKTKEYEDLYKYYQSCLSLFDLFLCNSLVSKTLYQQYFPKAAFAVIPVVHSGLSSRINEKIPNSRACILYMGGTSQEKGFVIMKEALSLLPQSGSIEVNCCGFGFCNNESDGVYHFLGYISGDEMERIWARTDVLVFPSNWPETYGFVVVEALSRGVPVICSDFVGSSVYVREVDEKMIFAHGDKADLARALSYSFSDGVLAAARSKIRKLRLPVDMGQHTKEITALYFQNSADNETRKVI